MSEATEHYSTLFETVPVGLFSSSPRGRIVDVNTTLVRMLGYPSRHALLAADATDLYVDPEDRHRWQQMLETAGVVHDFPIRARRHDQTEIWVRLSARAIRGEDGRIALFEGAVEDITETKAAQEALAYQAELLSSVSDAVIATDENFLVTSWNPAAEEIYGWTAEEVLGGPLPEGLVSGFSPEFIRDSLRTLADKGRIRAEMEQRRKDGTTVYVESVAMPMKDTDGRITGYVSVNRDITQRKHAEDDLQESLELLRRTSQDRRTLLSSLVNAQEEERRRIATDIHDDSIQILTAVSMRLEILRQTLEGEQQIRALEQLGDTVVMAITRMRHLLFELRPPTLDNEGLAPALRLYLAETFAGELEHSLEANVAEEPPLETRVILYRIAQEAVTNARKHSGATHVAVALEERDGGYFMRVEDDGGGFSPWGIAPTTGHLGIPAMRERAEYSGGWLHIDSKPGAGTRVEFWIPAEPSGKGE